MTPKDLPELTDVQASQNTDREVWRETPGDVYSNSVHLTATGGLGINVGGTVYVKPPAEWHRLASGARSTAAQPAGWLDDWEWEQLAWQLCAEEHGEDACNELTWTGGPIPEPWGDRWLTYESEAKRMIALVRQYAPPAAAQPVEPSAEVFCWLVELFEGDGTGNSAGWYHTGFVDIGGHPRTTKNAHEARRYTTREQADHIATKLGTTLTGTWRAVEHGFSTPAASGDSTPPSASVQGDSTERSGCRPEAVDRERGAR